MFSNPKKRINPIYLLIPIPCIILGCLTMYKSQVSPIIFAQNILVYILGAVFTYFISCKKTKLNDPSIIPIILSFILLSGTFLFPSINGVHRWIGIGPILFNISFIVIPILIFEISKISNWWVAFILSLSVSIILMLQPDVSQNAAFTLSILIILLCKLKRNKVKGALLILIILTSVYSLTHLDNLSPVSYVEGILKLMLGTSYTWYLIGMVSLCILIIPFLICFIRKHIPVYISFLIYILTSIIFSLYGNYPVPLLGYGASPIIGYFIFLYYLHNSVNNNKKSIFSNL